MLGLLRVQVLAGSNVIHYFSKILPRLCYEGVVLPEVGEDPSPRLQGRSPPWQGLRDLQVQPAFQGTPALSFAPVVLAEGRHARPSSFPGTPGRRNRGAFTEPA